MSKMNELSQVLDELTDCGRTMIRLAETLRDMYSADEPEKPTVAEPVKAEPTYAFVDVRKALSEKSHAGFTEQVKALLAKYDSDKLSGVDEACYPALMADLEEIK